MSLVYFSSNRLEVERLAKAMAEAGIPCEVRDGVAGPWMANSQAEAELWLQHESDCSRAFLFCVERDAGFARRRPLPLFSEMWDEAQAA